MEQRKNDHIDLAASSRTPPAEADSRFSYEPALGIHPADPLPVIPFAGKQLRAPLWVSSMTGGSREGGVINHNLARACAEFGLGMGLGSCRVLLDNPAVMPDFDVRGILGPTLPLFANIGIAQLERMTATGETGRLEELVHLLRADGLIIHLNPVQEWLQPEGDTISVRPVDTLQEFLSKTDLPLIVKEVGQGLGPASLRELLSMPLAALEFGAFGGTNFARLELSRQPEPRRELFAPIATVGHTAEDMVRMINGMLENGFNPACRQLIISGGITSFLDGFYLTSLSKLPALYGQAAGLLHYARGDYQHLHDYVAGQLEGLKFAHNFLKLRYQ